MNQNRFKIITIAFFLVSATVLAQESQFVAAVIHNTNGDVVKLNQVIEQHEKLIQNYNSLEFTPTILFQLAELYRQKSTLEFQQAMEEYDKAQKLFENGQSSQEPVLPRMVLSNTINCCLRIVNEFPETPFKDKVLYALAMAYLEEGNYIQANTYFEEITTQYPSSKINLESHFRIGEYYFDQHQFEKAIEHYKKLLDQWDSPYFDMSLYKLGWSFYNQADFNDAISTFLYLIQDFELLDHTASQKLGKSKTDLRSEAIQYIAGSFTESGGPEKARTFLSPLKEKDYTQPILLKMSELYQKRSDYNAAIQTNRLLLDFYPFHKNAPDYFLSIIDNYEQDGQGEKANQARAQFVTLYGPGSEWLSYYSTGDTYQKGVELCQNMLYYLGTYYQGEAQKNNRARDYYSAIAKYQEYLQKFPHARRSATVQYYLAECHYNLKNYEDAANAYHLVVTNYDTAKYRDESAYNRILCYYQLTGIDQPTDSLTIYLNEFLGAPEILTVRVVHKSEMDLLKACNEYVIMFPHSAWLSQVLMKYGELLYELHSFQAAAKTYKKVMQQGPDDPFQLVAAMNAGQCYFDAGLYDESEKWFQNLIEEYPDSTGYVEKAKKIAVSSRFKKAEKLGLQGQALEAAELMTSTVEKTNDTAFQERALFEAAAQYLKADSLIKAAETLERLVDQHPTCPFAEESLYKAAGLRERSNQWNRAAGNYLRLIDGYPATTYGKNALKNAAGCYENMNDYMSAKLVFERFAASYPESSDEVIEALFKSGEMSFKAHDPDEAMKSLSGTVSTYRSMKSAGVDVDSYFAANSQFLIGEILSSRYQEIKVTTEKELKQKSALFKNVVSAYTRTLEFNQADWSTAASCRIGAAFEEFGRALTEAPVPQGLAVTELEQYRTAMSSKIRPFKEKALETFKKCVEQAEANKIENQWVDESRKRMRALVIELGLSMN
jgi:cellulose synthase operon protein C